MKVKHIDDFLAIRASGERYPYSVFLKGQNRKGCYYGCFTKKNGSGWIQKCEDRRMHTYVPTLLSDHCIRSCESLLTVSALTFSMFTHCHRFSSHVSVWGACTYNARNRVESYDGYKFWDVRKSAQPCKIIVR